MIRLECTQEFFKARLTAGLSHLSLTYHGRSFIASPVMSSGVFRQGRAQWVRPFSSHEFLHSSRCQGFTGIRLAKKGYNYLAFAARIRLSASKVW